MPFLPTPLPGLMLFEPAVHRDERGYFMESYNERAFAGAGISHPFVQDNQAWSPYGVVRGLHYQTGAHAQAKLVRVILGEVFDVVVDLRPDSPTCGQAYGVMLSGENHRQLYVPAGFAHGYAVRSPEAVFFYKCSAYYHRASEGGLNPMDPALAIDWGIPANRIVLSDRDRSLPLWGDHLPPND